MKKLFQRAIAWLRSRVTVVNTQGVYDNVNEDENQLLFKKKKAKRHQTPADFGKEIVNCQLSRFVPASENQADLNSCSERSQSSTTKLLIVNSKSRLTIPEIEALLREKYELRYNVLTDESGNRRFRRRQPVEELFFRHYRLPLEGEEAQMLSATDIYEHLHGINSRLMKQVSAYRFGSILRALGVTRHQHHDRRVYAVIPLKR